MYSLVWALPEGLRADAATLLDLAFGLGMNGVQARDARTEHMRVRHGEVRLLVRTTRGWKERVAAPEVAERLLARARSVGEDAYLLRPGKSRKRCVEAIVVLMAEKEPGLAGFRVQRAADAWTVRLMTSAGLPALLEILGSSPTSHTLLDLLHYAPQADRGDCETVFRRMHAGSRS